MTKGYFCFLLLTLFGCFRHAAAQGLRQQKQQQAPEEEQRRRQLNHHHHHGGLVLNPNLKIIAFGTSHTYGAGLTNRSTLAFPSLLSPDAANLGIRASSPSYPALCLQTMISKTAYEQYDVILLEFILWAHHLDLLAKRLRERYPDALIIIIELWNPFRITRADTNEMVLTWMERNYPGIKYETPEYTNRIQMLTQPHEWKFQEEAESGRERYVQETAKEVGGFVYHLPRMTTAYEALVYQNKIFGVDRNHISEYGHGIVANGVANIINNHQFRLPPRLGTWGPGGGDSCLNWFETGEDVPTFHGINSEVRRFAPTKYSLEISMAGTAIQVENPFPTDRTLYLMYMVMGPPPSPYPKTIVTLPYNQQPNVELDTTTKLNTLNAHVTRVKQIGSVPPGSTIVHLFPVEDLALPFRLTGLAVSFDLGEDLQVQTPPV